MKLETQTRGKKAVVAGQVSTKEVGISKEKVGKLMHILSSGLYSNPKGTIVREYTSNCLDSHIEAKIKDPVIIRLTDNSIEFIDFGVGFSQKSFEDIFCNILESTKDESNEFLGMWGLGSKSAFSYTDTFTVTSVKDGIERMWVVRKNPDNSIIEADLIMSEKTKRTDLDGRNMTNVSIPIKSSHKQDFKREIVSQLKFFKNVFVYIDGNPWVEFNTLQIYEGKFFRKATTHDGSSMSLCLGDVQYPINWSDLGTPQINAPISLKFDIGELSVTPSREAIVWTENTKKVFKQRLQEACAEIVEDYNATSTEVIEDFSEYLERRAEKRYMQYPVGDKVYIGRLLPHSKVDARKGIYFKYDYLPQSVSFKSFSNRTFMTKNTDFASDISEVVLTSKNVYFGSNLRDNLTRISGVLFFEKLDSALFKYISLNVLKSKTIFLEWEDLSLSEFQDFNGNANSILLYDGSAIIPTQADVDKWNKAYREIFLDKYNVSDYKIPKSLKKKYYSRKSYVSDGEIVAGWGRDWNTNDVSYKKENFLLKSLADTKETVIFGTFEDRDALYPWFKLGVQTMCTAKSNFKHLKNLKNFIPLEKAKQSKMASQLTQQYVNSEAMNEDRDLATLLTNRKIIKDITNGKYDLENFPEVKEVLELEKPRSQLARNLLAELKQIHKCDKKGKVFEVVNGIRHLANVQYLQGSSVPHSKKGDLMYDDYSCVYHTLSEGATKFMREYHTLVIKNK